MGLPITRHATPLLSSIYPHSTRIQCGFCTAIPSSPHSLLYRRHRTYSMCQPSINIPFPVRYPMSSSWLVDNKFIFALWGRACVPLSTQALVPMSCPPNTRVSDLHRRIGCRERHISPAPPPSASTLPRHSLGFPSSIITE